MATVILMIKNLDRIKVFYHVYKEGSIIAASKRLHVSQSAVSQALQKLERETSGALFTRLHNKLVPTTAGKELYEIAQPFIVMLEKFLKSQEEGKEYPKGELNIGAPPEFGKAYLPAIVADFRLQYPDVTFMLEFGTPEKLLPLIKAGDLDFTLMDVFLTKSTLIGSLDLFNFSPLVEEEMILACSKNFYDQMVTGEPTASLLSELNFISYKKDQYTIKHWFKHHFSATNIAVNSALTVNNHEAVISAIRKDVGLGIVASHFVKKDVEKERIIHIKTKSPEIMNQIALVHLQDKVPTLTEKVFENFLRQTVGSIFQK